MLMLMPMPFDAVTECGYHRGRTAEP